MLAMKQLYMCMCEIMVMVWFESLNYIYLKLFLFTVIEQ